MGPVNGNLQVNALEFASFEGPDDGSTTAQLVSNPDLAWYETDTNDLTFCGDFANTATYVVNFGGVVTEVIDNIEFSNNDGSLAAIANGKTMFLINLGMALDLTVTGGNVRCPDGDTVQQNEGVILEYFGNIWYCMEHKRLL